MSEQSAENDALLDEVMACRFCVLGESGPLLCPKHSRVWRCNGCPDGLSRHPGRGHVIPPVKG